jgi:hypothetical protein
MEEEERRRRRESETKKKKVSGDGWKVTGKDVGRWSCKTTVHHEIAPTFHSFSINHVVLYRV